MTLTYRTQALTDCALDFDATLHSTTQNGASATFTFAGFNAVGALFDVVACSGMVVGSWTRDGQTGKVGIPCTSNTQTNYPFYPYIAGSSFGPSTIIVRNAGSVPFQLDRFIVGNITNNNPSPSSNTPAITMTSSTSTAPSSSGALISSSSQDTSPSSNSTISAGVTTVLNVGSSLVSAFEVATTGVSSSSVLSPQLTGVANKTPNSTHSSSPHSFPLGPIVGGVLGALALILLFIFLLMKCRPWQRGKIDRAETVPSSTLTPFNVQENAVGQVDPNQKTAFAEAETSLPSSSTATLSYQLSQISLPRPLYPSPSLPVPTENRTSLAPSYSYDPNRRYFQSGFSNVPATHTSVSMDVPPAYDNIRVSQVQPIP